MVMDYLPAVKIGPDKAARILENTVFYTEYGTVILFRDPRSFPIVLKINIFSNNIEHLFHFTTQNKDVLVMFFGFFLPALRSNISSGSNATTIGGGIGAAVAVLVIAALIVVIVIQRRR